MPHMAQRLRRARAGAAFGLRRGTRPGAAFGLWRGVRSGAGFAAAATGALAARVRLRATQPATSCCGTRDGRARANVRVVAHRHGRHQLRVAADLHARADRGAMLLEAVVVAGDGPGADVGVRADLAVAEVGEVIRLGPGTEHRLLGLDEVADVDALGESCPRAEACEWTDARIRADLGAVGDAAEEQVHALAERGVDQVGRAVEPAALADTGAATELHVRPDHGVAADGDLGAHV